MNITEFIVLLSVKFIDDRNELIRVTGGIRDVRNKVLATALLVRGRMK